MIMKNRHWLIGIVFLSLVVSYPQVSYAGTPFAADMKWSPDGSLLAVAGGNGVSLYDENLDHISRISDEPLYGALMYQQLSWSPDGQAFAAANATFNTISVWDVSDFVNRDPDYNYPILPEISYKNEKLPFMGSVVWDFDNNIFALSYENKLYVFDSANLQIRNQFKLADINSYNFVLSPDGKKLAYAVQGFQGKLSVQILDKESGEAIHAFAVADATSIWHLSWDQQGRITVGECLKTGCNQIEVYDSETGQVLHVLSTPESFLYFDWSPNGQYLALTVDTPNFTDHDYIEIRSAEGDLLRRFVPEEGDYYSIAWHPGGAKIAVSLFSKDTLQMLDVADLPQ